MRGVAFLATILFFLMPVLVMSGDIDGAAAAEIALPGFLTLIVLLASFSVMDRLIEYIQASSPPQDDHEPAPTDLPSAAALGLYFGCVLVGGFALILYFRDHPIVAELIAWDFSGRRPGFVLIVLPLVLLLGYARWLDNRTDT